LDIMMGAIAPAGKPQLSQFPARMVSWRKTAREVSVRLHLSITALGIGANHSAELLRVEPLD